MIQALGVAAVALGKKATVHMEIDTGLGRFGFMREQAVHRAKLILGTPGLHLEGISTHFANSSGDPSGTDTQVHRFQEVLSDLRKEGIEFEITHMANSAGAVRYPEARGNLVRSGIGVYGMDPYDLFEGEERPVMRWYARIMVMRDLKPGARVSYNGTYETKGDERIATLGIGYGDGYDRALSNRGSVWVNGQRAPVVGLVCMDQMMVNVTGIEGVKEGDVVEVAGEHVPIRELAALAETNPHEITCRITARTPRHYLEG